MSEQEKPMEPVIIVRYAEIHLKGLNRPYFERSLVRRIQLALNPLPAKVVREQGRIFVFNVPGEELDGAADKLTRVFGIHSVSPAVAAEKEWEPIVEAAGKIVGTRIAGLEHATFKVISRRSDKRFPMRSEEICRTLGGLLLEAFPALSVDVHTPDFYVGVEIRQNQAFIFAEERLGAGGMPVGCNGHAMLLVSGGIDSPVAGYMIAKRGVRVSAVHFFSYPYTSERARDKVVDLVRILSAYAGSVTLHLVPFTEIQLAIYEKCPQSETTVLMRRLMMQIAERIALANGAQALVTGESIGQVASQTIESLTVTNDAVTLPVFRPLIGFDKEEIVDRAKTIGSFETSILPYEDCCTVFVPQHPVTKPKLTDIRRSEKLVDFEPMIEKALHETIVQDVE
jgi:thiamine biosynthesis protein ThiI